MTAKGGWVGDSGGRLEVTGGLLVADELNFEGRSTLAITSGGKIVAGEMTVATGSKNSSLDNGTIFINTKLKLAGNKNNFVSGSGNFSVVFYGAQMFLWKQAEVILPREVVCGRGRGVSEAETGKRQLYQRIYMYREYFKVDVYGREESVICDGERQVE